MEAVVRFNISFLATFRAAFKKIFFIVQDSLDYGFIPAIRQARSKQKNDRAGRLGFRQCSATLAPLTSAIRFTLLRIHRWNSSLHKRPFTCEVKVPRVNRQLWPILDHTAKAAHLRLQKSRKLLTGRSV